MLFFCPTQTKPSQHFGAAMSHELNSGTHACGPAVRDARDLGKTASEGDDADAAGASPQEEEAVVAAGAGTGS
jgi:hypothetical protein